MSIFKGAGVAIVTPMKAVSYTHLDVYKRQAYYRTGIVNRK